MDNKMIARAGDQWIERVKILWRAGCRIIPAIFYSPANSSKILSERNRHLIHDPSFLVGKQIRDAARVIIIGTSSTQGLKFIIIPSFSMIILEPRSITKKIRLPSRIRILIQELGIGSGAANCPNSGSYHLAPSW